MSDKPFGTLVLGYLARTEVPFDKPPHTRPQGGFFTQLRSALAFGPSESNQPAPNDVPPYFVLFDRTNSDLSTEHVDATGADLRRADLARKKLTKYVFVDAILESANLHKAYLGGVDLARARLTDANLSQATLIGANLREATLRRADLAHATLRHANLRDADLSQSNLFGANLTGADVIGANLTNANLAQTRLVGVRWSLDTAWPAEFYESVRVWSEELEFGVFRIRADDARDRTPVPELLPV